MKHFNNTDNSSFIKNNTKQNEIIQISNIYLKIKQNENTCQNCFFMKTYNNICNNCRIMDKLSYEQINIKKLRKQKLNVLRQINN